MIPFYRPFFDQSELWAALRPGAGRGEFESAVAARLGAQYGIATAYARSGIIAALKALGLVHSEVIVPAYTCEVVAQAIVVSGNQPVFVDIDLSDYNVDLKAIRKVLTPQTRAIVATHMFGYPTDVNAIRAMAGDERIVIIEDRAQCLLTPSAGATSLRGDIGLCSFGPNKQLSTIQGGVIVTHSSYLYEKIRAFRDQEMNRVSIRTWAKRWARFVASYLIFHRLFHGILQRVGLTSRKRQKDGNSGSSQTAMPSDYATAYQNFQGRIGLAQLDKLDTIMAKRRALADLYSRELDHVPGLSPAPMISDATFAYYTVRISRRDQIDFPRRMHLQGVAVDQTYDYAVPCLEAYRSFARSTYPRAEQAAREVVNLPIYPDLSLASARYAAECTRRAVRDDFATTG